MQPPKTTEGITPINLAVMPLSNCPNSLLLFINIELTLITLPRILSGVFSCKIVPRVTTLMPSKKPLTSNAANETQNIFDSANMMMQTPKPATAYSNFLPCFLRIGNKVSSIIIITEPISEAAFSQPKPTGPTSKMSLANMVS